ncbi:MAG: peptidoglycan DD-metalloendopeptidase family protein [Clostridiales bacterium]|nr:peptidoglycan DD-metalloendopeptidase family protein [Clostridiales bacterium]
MKFKNKLKRIVAITAAFVLAATMFVSNSSKNYQLSTSATSAADKISGYQKQLDDYKKKQAELDAQIAKDQAALDNEKATQSNISAQIDTVEDTLELLTTHIFEINTKIKKCEDDIANTQADIADKKAQIETNKNEFMARLRAMYISGDDSYGNILLNSSDFYDMLMRYELVQRVADHDNAIIAELIDLTKQLESQEIALNNQMAELEEQQTAYEISKEEQTAQRIKLTDLYSSSEEKIDQYQASLDDAHDSHDIIHQYESELDDIIDDLIKQEEARKKAEEEARKKAEEEAKKNNQKPGNSGTGGSSSSSNRPSGSGVFLWPVPGYYKITYGMGWRWGSMHKGIDISQSGINGANIVASDSGKVIRVSNSCPHNYKKEINKSCKCGGGYGRHVVIDHGNGFITLYAHATSINVSVGQEVKQGQVIGTVGSTGWSTGPHLHFEIRINNVQVDPDKYL